MYQPSCSPTPGRKASGSRPIEFAASIRRRNDTDRLCTHRLRAATVGGVPKSQPDRAALGRAVRALRQENGMTQEALGHVAGLHWTYIGGIERGERNPS